MAFKEPEIVLTSNTPEEIEAATAYVTRHAPDLLETLGLVEAPEVRPQYKSVTHCPKGHEFTEANTIWRTDANRREKRRCRECKNAYTREWSKGRPTRKKKPQ